MLSFSHPADTFLNRFDPRAKLVLLITVIVIFFLPVHIIHLAVLSFLIMVLSSMVFGIRAGLKPLKSFIPIFLLIGLLAPLFSNAGNTLISLFNGFIRITDLGLLKAARLILRLAGVSLFIYIYFITTELSQFVLTLRFFLLPFRAALVISAAVRYIPLLASAGSKIKNSEKLLGINKSRIVSLLTGLTIYAVKQIPVLAANLESRGVFRKNKRTSYFILPPARKLALDTLICLSIIGLIIFPVFLY